MSRDPNSFNLGNAVGLPASVDLSKKPEAFSFQFHPKPGRLMDADIHIFLEGNNEVGGTLRVLVNRPKMIEMESSDFATQWHRAGKAIPWENGRTYTIQDADRGHYIGCWVTDAKKLDSGLVHIQ